MLEVSDQLEQKLYKLGLAVPFQKDQGMDDQVVVLYTATEVWANQVVAPHVAIEFLNPVIFGFLYFVGGADHLGKLQGEDDDALLDVDGPELLREKKALNLGQLAEKLVKNFIWL